MPLAHPCLAQQSVRVLGILDPVSGFRASRVRGVGTRKRDPGCEILVPVSLRLHNMHVQSNGWIHIGVCLLPHGVGRVRPRFVPQDRTMYVLVC